ncbi:MAG: phospholipid-binding lipoprotein MlaA [Halioglobus sp.]|jgi:phospholipid-binding lipoprotein MlaA
MTCTASAILATNNRKLRASLRRVSHRPSGLALALAFVWGVLLTTLPLTSHANQDPLVGMNRTVHGFNRAMDSAVLRPIAKTYTTVTPPFVKRRVNSFFNNIDDVRVAINALLQLKFKQAAGDATRVVLNTTLGLGGLFDVANPALGLEKHDEDFGQTLGFWAVKPGPYLELPFLGPSTARDSAGTLVDTLLNPLQLLRGSQSIALAAGDSVNDRAALLDVEGLISGDNYVFIREVYLQRRESLVHDGQVQDSFSGFGFGFDEEFFEDMELDAVDAETPLGVANSDCS